jgi:hypothetical protein
MLQTGLYRLTGITFRNKADGLGLGRNVGTDQVYRETEQQFHVYQDREAEVSRHRHLPGSWF